MKKTPDENSQTCFRLGGDRVTQVECLPMLGRVFLQTRNPGGGLGKWVESLTPLVVEGFAHAFDPDVGLGFSMERLMALHLLRGNDALQGPEVLDFDFEGYPAGISVLEIPNISKSNAIAEYADFLGKREVSADRLKAWRDGNRSPAGICSCCAEKAEHRAKNAEFHPFANIFDHAAVCGLPLRCRLQSEHADLTAEIIPSRVAAMDGFLVVDDLDDRAMLHLNLRMVHAFCIDHAVVEGQRLSRLTIYDMHGNLNFEMSSEIEEMAAVWRGLNQSAEMPYRLGEPD